MAEASKEIREFFEAYAKATRSLDLAFFESAYGDTFMFASPGGVIDTKVLGRKTYEASLGLGAKFDAKSRHLVFSRHPPADAPPGVEFVNDAIGPFVNRLREQSGKDFWLMGGGEIIASFLDAQAIDEFVIIVALHRTLRRWARPTPLRRAEHGVVMMRSQQSWSPWATICGPPGSTGAERFNEAPADDAFNDRRLP